MNTNADCGGMVNGGGYSNFCWCGVGTVDATRYHAVALLWCSNDTVVGCFCNVLLACTAGITEE